MPLVSDNLYPSRLPPRIPLLPVIDSRNGSLSVDSRLTNGFMEKDEQGDWWVNKRPGFVYYATDVGASGTGLGLYYWSQTGKLYAISATSGLLRALQFGVFSTVGAVDTSPAFPYDFQELQGTPRTLFIKNRTNAYVLTSTGVLTAVTSLDYPGNTYPLVRGSAYLDGTVYVMTTSAEIYGSAINDALTWDPLNMIRAQIEPDSGVALAKQASYVVAFKQWTTEFFYNAGAYNGTLTGSPLLPVANAKIPMGCAYADSVQSIDDVLYFVGRNRTVDPGVYAIRGLKLEKLSTFAVDKALANSAVGKSWQLRLGGHTYYCFDLQASPTYTLVFDVSTRLWYTWSLQNASLDVLACASDLDSGLNVFQGSNGADLRIMDVETYIDTDAARVQIPVVCDAITPLFDAGTSLGKVLSKLRIVCDQNSGGSLQIRWSDDDYQKWSNWITVNLQDDVPFLTNLGRFTKRAFQYRHISPTPYRMSAFEVDLLLCPI